MLGKLFIYEWKSFWKVPAAINIILGVVTLAGMASLITPFWDIDSVVINVLMVTAILFYVIAIFGGMIAVSIYTAIRFYRNIYTDEGYLTNTLPVTPRMIILSKLFVSSIWSVITGIVVILSIFTLVYTTMLSYEGINIFRELLEYDEFWEELARLIGLQWDSNFFAVALYTITSILYSILRVFFSILMLYAAISLGQLFTKHKVAGAVAWYIAEYIVVQFASSLLTSMLVVTDIYHTSYYDYSVIFDPMLYGGFVLTLLCSLGLFFLTEFMLSKRLNLD